MIYEAHSPSPEPSQTTDGLLVGGLVNPFDIEGTAAPSQPDCCLQPQATLNQGHRFHQHIVMGEDFLSALKDSLQPFLGPGILGICLIGRGIDGRCVQEDYRR